MLERLKGIVAVGSGIIAIVSAILLFFDCKSWNSCFGSSQTDTIVKPSKVFNGDSPRVGEEFQGEEMKKAADLIRDLVADLDKICDRQDLQQQLFAKSPCRTMDFRSVHLSDSSYIGKDAAAVRSHSDTISDAIRRFVARVKRTDNYTLDLANTYRDWNNRRIVELNSLLQRKSSWGELNSFRVRSNADLENSIEFFIRSKAGS